MRLRQEQAQPVLAELHAWLLTPSKSVAAGSSTRKAIDHAFKRWPALLRYADSGTLPIDNNPVENAIRPIAVGKKNWLFAGAERAGRRAAAIQSLLATAKLNGLEPLRWLTETLQKLPPAQTTNSIPCCHYQSLPSLIKQARWDGWPLTIEQHAGPDERPLGRLDFKVLEC